MLIQPELRKKIEEDDKKKSAKEAKEAREAENKIRRKMHLPEIAEECGSLWQVPLREC